MSIQITKSSMPFLEDYIDEIKDIWDSRWLTNNGSKHRKLQEQLIRYLAVENIDLLTNGHMALEIAIQAMDLKGEIITTPFTFASTTQAIVRNGIKPVFCDINPFDFTIDVNKIENLITEKTTAILPVHVYGNVCDVHPIEQIARKHNLKVIYDAAHAFGVTYKGIGIGNFGDASCFSFHATKVFHTIEGGAICFSDKYIGEKVSKIKNFGIESAEDVTEVGTNAKMNEFCAAMGLCNLKHVDFEIEKRKKIFNRYYERLNNVDGLRLNKLQENVKSNYAYFPIIIYENIFKESRDDLLKRLNDREIYPRKYFYPTTNSFSCYNNKYNIDNTPIATSVSKRVLTLPLYSDLSLSDVDFICDTILRR